MKFDVRYSALENLISNHYEGKIGQADLESPLGRLEVFLTADPCEDDISYSLECKIEAYNTMEAPLAPKRTRWGVGYKVKANEDSLIILEKDSGEYCIERNDDEIKILTANYQSNTPVKKYLSQFFFVAKKIIQAQYKLAKTPVPNITVHIANRMPKKQAKETKELEQLERKIEISQPNVTFEDIGGLCEPKRQMLTIYEDIVSPNRARYFGIDPDKTKGYLLNAPAGCGKTLLVTALAQKLKSELSDKIKFYKVDYSAITSIYRGGEAQATAQIFELVKENQKKGLKTLLFLDELHLIGRRTRLGGNDEALDTLLSHLGGLENYPGLCVIGSTNFPIEDLDPALIRDGRLGKWIKIELPNKEERKEIYKITIKKRQEIARRAGNPALFKDIVLDILAKESEDFTGSNIVGVIDKIIEEKRRTTDDIRNFKSITTEDIVKTIRSFEKQSRKDFGFKASK
ncbi:ATP-binding protein [Candidatus Woesearchaeota archaeon]|nr:MAG: ATP-binding protein [Candidatus Woesearchaeota archaeon]